MAAKELRGGVDRRRRPSKLWQGFSEGVTSARIQLKYMQMCANPQTMTVSQFNAGDKKNDRMNQLIFLIIFYI